MKKTLLVEGSDDLHVVANLFKARHGKSIESFIHIVDSKGIEGLLTKIIPDYKASEVLGIIIDANSSLNSRWQQLRDYFKKVNIILPDPDKNGIYFTDDIGKKIGI